MIIKISDNKIYFNKIESISLNKTNFPKENLMFNNRIEILWEIKQDEYDIENKVLVTEVVDYFSDKLKYFESQTIKLDIAKIKFVNLIWEKLGHFLTIYKKVELEPLLKQTEISKIEKKPRLEKYLFDIDDSEEYNVTFKVPIIDTKFEDGYILLKKEFSFYHKLIEIKIYNINITKNHDLLKPYFSRFLKKKRFNITALIEIGKEFKITARSPEVDMISNNLIQQIRKKQILDFLKLEQSSDKRNFLTLQEVLEQLNETTDPKLFEEKINSILNTILQDKKVRNEKQIRYFAGRQSTDYTLKLTLKPQLGFVFHIKGKNRNYYCWELLNSHATYLWEVDINKKRDYLLKIVEESISFIIDHGRLNYRKHYEKEFQNKGFKFHSITHEKTSKNLDISFNNWKIKIVEIMNK